MAPGGLVGRDRELDEVAARLGSHRIVTVVGPGGVGKTALANAAADRVRPRFALGVHAVDLTRVDHPDAVPGAIASQLGFASFESLLSAPGEQPALLLLDNCEHLLDAVASCAMQVLGACRQPSLLATSRSPLELPGESVVAVAPLPVPHDADDAASFASVQLFLERLRDAGVEAIDIDLAVLADLSRRLDGLPLAIEIAAARARTLTLPEIARGLAEGQALLHRPRFRGDPRHRSVSDAIGWSYQLLTPAAARLLDRLAVFAGPFTMPSARAVAEPGDADLVDAAMDELVNASLVTRDPGAHPARYRLLDTVRRFAGERLEHSGARGEAYDRFADHAVSSLRGLLADSASSWRPDLIRDLVALFDDIAEALRWCVANDELPKRAFALCGSLWGIVHQGRADDVAESARAVLARWPDTGSQSAAMAAATLATAEYTTGHSERALELATASLARLSADGPASVTLRRVIGQSRRALGDLAGAEHAFRAGAEIGHGVGLGAMAIELDCAAAIVAADRGRVDAALAELDQSIDRAVGMGSPLSVCWLRTALGWVLLRTDPVAARPAIEQALEQSVAIDYPIGIAVGLRSRAYARLLDGDLDGATAAARELADELLARGTLSNLRLLCDVVGVLAHGRAHPAWPSLVATTRAAPITTLVCAHFELVPLPTVDVAPLTPRDAIRTMRQVLDELSTGAPGSPDSGDDAEPVPEATIRRLGDVIEFTYAGRAVAVRASKGLADVVTLIAAAGREVHCAELAGVTVEQASTGEVIDRAARRQYEERIRDLQAEIDEAEANADYARSYRYQTELDTLVEHLTAALGPGKRTRRAADSAERARSAVTHRVRSAVRQLTEVHPPLGRHLAHAIATGTYCSYRPERPVAWHVEEPSLTT